MCAYICEAGLTGSCGRVGVIGMCELMLVSAYVWEVGLSLCISRMLSHTFAYPDYPEIYSHTPAPWCRHTPLCRCVLMLVCRLPAYFSVSFVRAVLEDLGCP
jgi:hypothetical protein